MEGRLAGDGMGRIESFDTELWLYPENNAEPRQRFRLQRMA